MSAPVLPEWAKVGRTGPQHTTAAVGESSAYGQRALDEECRRVATAANGTRNNTLNDAIFRMAQLVAGGELDRSIVLQRLEAAAITCGLGKPEIEATLKSGFAAGVSTPRFAPERGELSHPSSRHAVRGAFENDPEPDMSIVQRNAVKIPEFPLDVFGPAGDWVRDTARSKNAPIDYVALGLLVATAGTIGTKRLVAPWADWTEPSILWGALVGEPSTNKSPGIDPIRAAILEIEQQRNAEWLTLQADYETKKKIAELHREKWEHDLDTAIKAGKPDIPMPSEAITPKEPTRFRAWMSDATTEKAALLLSENPAGLICFRDELAGLIGGFDRYSGSGGDRAFWLEAFGGRPHRYDRMSLKGECIDIPFNAISLLGAVQPDRLNSMLLAGDNDGLASRLLFAWPDPVRPQRPTQRPDHVTLKSVLTKLSELAFEVDSDGSPRPRVVFLHPDAADEFSSWWQGKQWDAKTAVTGSIAGAIGKLDGITLRIAAALEFLSWGWRRSNEPEPDQIGMQSVLGAMKIIDEWARFNIQRVYAEASLPEAQRDAMLVGRWLLSQKPRLKIVNARELSRTRGFTGPKDPKKLAAALEILIDAQWLAPIRDEGAHRPRKDFSVNAAIYRDSS